MSHHSLTIDYENRDNSATDQPSSATLSHIKFPTCFNHSPSCQYPSKGSRSFGIQERCPNYTNLQAPTSPLVSYQYNYSLYFPKPSQPSQSLPRQHLFKLSDLFRTDRPDNMCQRIHAKWACGHPLINHRCRKVICGCPREICSCANPRCGCDNIFPILCNLGEYRGPHERGRFCCTETDMEGQDLDFKETWDVKCSKCQEKEGMKRERVKNEKREKWAKEKKVRKNMSLMGRRAQMWMGQRR